MSAAPVEGPPYFFLNRALLRVNPALDPPLFFGCYCCYGSVTVPCCSLTRLWRSDVHGASILSHRLTQSVTWLHVPVERVSLPTRVSTQGARQWALVRVLHPMNFEMLPFTKLPSTTRKLTGHARRRAVYTTSGSGKWRHNWATWPTFDCLPVAVDSL